MGLASVQKVSNDLPASKARDLSALRFRANIYGEFLLFFFFPLYEICCGNHENRPVNAARRRFCVRYASYHVSVVRMWFQAYARLSRLDKEPCTCVTLGALQERSQVHCVNLAIARLDA